MVIKCSEQFFICSQPIEFCSAKYDLKILLHSQKYNPLTPFKHCSGLFRVNPC